MCLASCLLSTFVKVVPLGPKLLRPAMVSSLLLLLSAAGERHGGPVRPVPSFPSFSLNNTITLSPDYPRSSFFPLSCLWSRTQFHRSSNFSAGSWPKSVMDEVVELYEQTHCWSAVADGSNPGTCCMEIHCYNSSIRATRSKEAGSLCLQSLLVIRIFGGSLLDGCFLWSMLQNMYFMVVVICFLKLDFRGVKNFKLECFFCILKTRVADDLSEDGGSCSCGSIHQLQVREPLLLIPRSHEQGYFRLGSVLRPQDLQLNHLLPLVHPPAQLPEELLAP